MEIKITWNSYSVVKTMKDRSNIAKGQSFWNNSSNAGNKSNMTKQNTDYLFARQLSEEMGSSINRIQPGGKASNYDKVSRNSSEQYRPPTNESNKMFDFGVLNQDHGVNFDAIGEHLSDEDQDESSKVTNNFGSRNRNRELEIIKEIKDRPEISVKEPSSATTPILASTFNINPEGSEYSSTSERDNKNKMSKIPTSSFNHENSISSSREHDSFNKDSDEESKNSFYNININSAKVSNESEKKKLPAIQKGIFKRSQTKVSPYKSKNKDTRSSYLIKNSSYGKFRVEEQMLIKYICPTPSVNSNLFKVAKEINNTMRQKSSSQPDLVNNLQWRKIKVQNLNMSEYSWIKSYVSFKIELRNQILQ